MLKGCIIYKQLCTLTYICLLTIYLFCNVMYVYVKENVIIVVGGCVLCDCIYLLLWFCISIIVVLNILVLSYFLVLYLQ